MTEHSYATSMFGFLIAKENYPLFDSKNDILMGLIHDLPEAHAGDVVPMDNVSKGA